MKRNLILNFLFFFIFTFCSSQEPMRIGFIGSLTGTYHELGTDSRNGVQLAIEKFNSEGGINGKRIELIIKDDGSDPSQALEVIKELHQSKINIFIGPSNSSSMSAILPYINQHQILAISPLSSSKIFKGLDDYLIRLVPSSEFTSERIAEILFEKKLDSVSIVYDTNNISFTQDYYEIFKTKYESLGGKIIKVLKFNSTQKIPYLEIAKEFQKTGSKAILAISKGHETALLCQQLEKIKSPLSVFASQMAFSNDLLHQGGKSVERLTVSTVFDFFSTKPEFLSYKTRYLNLYKKEPNYFSIFSYDAAKVLFEILQEIQEACPNKIKQAILKKSKFNGLHDDFEIDRYGDVKRNIFLYQIKNNQFIKAQLNE